MASRESPAAMAIAQDMAESRSTTSRSSLTTMGATRVTARAAPHRTVEHSRDITAAERPPAPAAEHLLDPAAEHLRGPKAATVGLHAPREAAATAIAPPRVAAALPAASDLRATVAAEVLPSPLAPALRAERAATETAQEAADKAHNALLSRRHSLYIYYKKNTDTMKKYVCDVCGWEYDPAVGVPEAGIEPGTAFEDLPEDFECPLCGVGKDEFSEA